MGIRDKFTRENALNALKSAGKLRVKTDHDSLITFSVLLLILFIAFGIRLFPLRWEIQTGAVHITEFDGYFQFRFTDYMVKNGFISWTYPTQWVDKQRWYPRGANVAVTGFPGLPMTAAFLFRIVTALGVNIDLMSFCAILPAFLGMLASLAIYFLGKDVGGKPMGFLAALFLTFSPSYIQRSQVGWFDDEINGILALLVFVFLFLRAIEDDRPAPSALKYALGAGLVLGYFTSGWGAGYYPIAVASLFTFVLILLRRYSQRLFLSYSVTFGLGLFIASNVPKITISYLLTSAILPTALVFVLLCFLEIFRLVPSLKWRIIILASLCAALIGGFSVMWQFGYMQGIAGKFISVLDPFSRALAPLVESVAEHRISSWGSIYYDFGVLILFFIAGLYFVIRNPSNKNIFILIFGLSALYFGSSMVRLIVLMAPAYALLASAGTVGLLKPFITLLKEPPKIALRKKVTQDYVGKEFSGIAVIMIFLLLLTSLAFPLPKVYKQVNSPVTITAASLPIAPSIPVTEWLEMLTWTQNNLNPGTVVSSWWDYGYWLTVLGNVTSLADNATINTTQIENIGFMFMGNETQAVKMMKLYNASYILVFESFDVNGNWVGYGDEGKWMWMARISGKAHDRFVFNKDLNPLIGIDNGTMWYDETTFGEYNSTQNKWIWNARGMNTTIYALMSYAKNEWLSANGVTDPDTPVTPLYFKEAFFAGKSLTTTSASSYGNIVPYICLYEINWEQYNFDYPNG